jgi:predicted nucleotidyltransferase
MITMVQGINNMEINNIVSRIIQKFSAKENFLFGSYAYGNPHADSDIDLCIITNQDGRKIDLLKQARRVISPVANKAVDIVIYNENEFYTRANLNTTFEFQIKNEGIKLYEKSGHSQ